MSLPSLVACSKSSPDSEGASGSVAKNVAPVNQASRPASQPASAPHGQINAGPPGEPVAGVVKLDGAIGADTVKATDVLFIMARESQGGGKGGRLVAVQRHGKVNFPKRYELTAKDAMIPGVPFRGPFVVYARLDKDGDPMTRGPDDLYGAVPQPVSSGQDDAVIILKKRPADDSDRPAPH